MTEKINNGAEDLRWILMYPRGATVLHPGGDYVVTDEMIDQMSSAHNYLRSKYKYVPPVLKQHEDDGWTYGRVSQFREDDEGLWGGAELAGGLAERYDAGMMDNWSPSHYPVWVDPQTGDEWPNVLAELSFVAIPHILDSGGESEHYEKIQMSRQLFAACANKTEEVKMEDENPGGGGESTATLDDVIELIGALVARVDALEMAGEEVENETDPVDNDATPVTTEAVTNSAADLATQTEMVRMSREIEQLKTSNASLEIKAELPNASAEEVQMLVSMSSKQRLFTIAKMAVKPSTITTQAQVSNGAQGQPVTTFRVMCAAAHKAGVKPGAPLMAYANKQYGMNMAAFSERYDEEVLAEEFGL